MNAPLSRPKSDLRRALKTRIDQHFSESGRDPRGGRALHAKAVILLGWAAISYGVLVFAPIPWWLGVLPAMSLGVAMAGIGFNILHDGGHGSFATRRGLNRLAARSCELLGLSSYFWHYKHNVWHHGFANVNGLDIDIDIAPLGRFSPHQPRRWWHRWQHLYMPFVYGLLEVYWTFWSDPVAIVTSRVGHHEVPRAPLREHLWFWGAKLWFVAIAIVVPLLMHDPLTWLMGFGVVMFTAGFVPSLVFQLAHVVEEAEFPEAVDGALDGEWAEHQLRTSVDLAPNNRWLTWYSGGLNFQATHHLFPAIAHTHYPALSRIIAEVAEEHGIPYRCTPSLLGALRSHFRHLRRLGQA